MKKKLLITTLAIFVCSVCTSAYAEQKQYIQTMKENEIKQEQYQREQAKARTQRLMDRVYGNASPTIEFKTDYEQEDIPTQCWGGPCRGR